MPYRKFRDADGNEWQVWAVVPRRFIGPEAWEGIDRRAPDPVLRYAGRDRRAEATRPTPPVLSPGLEGGWLTFECGSEKRRIVPIPPGWEQADDDALAALCRTAPVVPRAKLA